MEATTITCPQCHHSFALTAAIEQPIVERLRSQFDAESRQKETVLKAKELELTKQAEELKKAKEGVQQQVEQKLVEERKRIATEQEQKAKESVSVQLRDLQQQVDDKSKKLNEAQKAQLELLKQKRDLDEAKSAFELEKAKQIEAERKKIREEATKAAMETATKDMRELQEKLAAKDDALKQAQEAELNLRKEKAAFEEQKKAFELEVSRRTDEVKATVGKAKDEEFRLKEAEANKKMEDMKKQIDELKRKAEQGSQQTQGEVLELDLEAALTRCFADDEITPVGKGVQGGDIIQHVRDETAHGCGIILWESKRTKAWSDGWIGKLKDDKLAAKAQLAVIVSVAMPKDVPSFECRDDVWITPPNLAVALGAALRLSLIETAAAKRAIEGRQDKMAVVYDYLSGPEFKGRVTAIVEAFTSMRDDLISEKTAMLKIWAKREKQIERVIGNTAGMYGDLHGIIGKSLPTIETLELASIVGDGKPVARLEG